MSMLLFWLSTTYCKAKKTWRSLDLVVHFSPQKRKSINYYLLTAYNCLIRYFLGRTQVGVTSLQQHVNWHGYMILHSSTYTSINKKIHKLYWMTSGLCKLYNFFFFFFFFVCVWEWKILFFEYLLTLVQLQKEDRIKLDKGKRKRGWLITMNFNV